MKLMILLCLISFSFNGFAIDTHKQVNSSIPALARTKLITFLGEGLDVDVMTSTKEGHWLLVAESAREFSSASFFNKMKGRGSMSIRKKINDFILAGWGVDSVGITPDNNWVITAGKRRYYSSVSKFKEIGLYDALETYLPAVDSIPQIAIDRNNKWAFIAKVNANYAPVIFSPGIPHKLEDAIMDARRDSLMPRVLKFKPNSSEWLFIAGQKVFTSRGISRGVKTWVEKYNNFKWQTDKVFLTPNGGWSVISNQRNVR